jgi:hypothetical protein
MLVNGHCHALATLPPWKKTAQYQLERAGSPQSIWTQQQDKSPCWDSRTPILCYAAVTILKEPPNLLCTHFTYMASNEPCTHIPYIFSLLVLILKTLI